MNEANSVHRAHRQGAYALANTAGYDFDFAAVI
jgi:hypothetical protein